MGTEEGEREDQDWERRTALGTKEEEDPTARVRSRTELACEGEAKGGRQRRRREESREREAQGRKSSSARGRARAEPRLKPVRVSATPPEGSSAAGWIPVSSGERSWSAESMSGLLSLLSAAAGKAPDSTRTAPESRSNSDSSRSAEATSSRRRSKSKAVVPTHRDQRDCVGWARGPRAREDVEERGAAVEAHLERTCRAARCHVQRVRDCKVLEADGMQRLCPGVDCKVAPPDVVER
eukprot:1966821-Rhodomonas_salina.1